MTTTSWPEPVVRAMQTVAGLPCVDTIGEPIEDVSTGWRIPLSIRRAAPEDTCPVVPLVTTWCALVEPSYPEGLVEFYPDGATPVEATFPHQLCNEPGPDEPRRNGKLCLETTRSRALRSSAGADPVGDADARLAWYVNRARIWLDAACRDALMDPAEPFELPHLPRFSSAAVGTVVHDEGPETYRTWQGVTGQFGMVELRTLAGTDTVRLAARFGAPGGETLRRIRRPTAAAETVDADLHAFWWLWPQPIVLPPWRAPLTWGQLRAAGQAQGVRVDRTLKRLSSSPPGSTVIVLLGYPIPERWHGASTEVHWQALHLPSLPAGLPPQHGFRDNPDGRWHKLRSKVLLDDTVLGYVRTANWHPARLQARGRLAAPLLGRAACVIGAGALGAAVAELLARGGCERLVLIDGQELEIGNLVRHPLTISELGRNKAEALAERLRTAAPMATIEASASDLPLDDKAALRELLEDVAIVCDCTGENAVIDALSRPAWAMPKVFLSASLGHAARRLFLFAAAGQKFDADGFWEAIAPWGDDESVRTDGVGELLEGAGCWSPLFPARGDDVWLAAAATVRHLERLMDAPSAVGSQLLVLDQIAPPSCGFVPVEPRESHE